MTTRDIMLAGGGQVAAGQAAFTTPGTYSWVVPDGVISVSVVCVGGGGPGVNGGTGNAPGGGALAYVNNISVTPYETMTVVVGAGGQPSTSAGTGKTVTEGTNSAFKRGSTFLVHAGAGSSTGTGGSVLVGTGGAGGAGGTGTSSRGGGGAGGYSGAGGAGASSFSTAGSAGTGGAGGGGGGGQQNYNSGSFTTNLAGGSGGGVGILGQGSNGAGGTAGINDYGGGGGGGSGGSNGGSISAGGAYGGGGAVGNYVTSVPLYQVGYAGGGGAVRIIWSGTSGTVRAFPSTNTGNL